ncbi:hypothetical protein Goari_009944, partial [Gossypium aridum]|nr:hypothetical protein [Gossypium aridum]
MVDLLSLLNIINVLCGWMTLDCPFLFGGGGLLVGWGGVLDRGEKIELLVDKTENLQFQLPEARAATAAEDVAAESANETDGRGSYSCVDYPFVGFCVWRYNSDGQLFLPYFHMEDKHLKHLCFSFVKSDLLDLPDTLISCSSVDAIAAGVLGLVWMGGMFTSGEVKNSSGGEISYYSGEIGYCS